ncbi:hypothetical protein F4820DRAFT_421635 [Hypoxylon rubiginosum]|uniref:Uncharacterized protein n=1 Tax=Hypoxylon rubiginosum TaxID=110542 RepID=A0ACB9Z1J3_9PEZI|nr:hypothetical protein F4820DRAFT_421635 [Hypoxylon rubiginosum]
MSLEQPRLSSGLDEGRRSTSSRRAGKDSRSREQSRHSFASYTTCEEELPEVFPAMEDQCIIEEATVMDAREVTIKTPKLPEKSALRASRLLEGLKLNTIEATNDPHDVYLSSEEDASSSADDFSDYDYDSTSEESEKSPVRRRSQEDTARAVSVVFIGKPCVIDLASGRRSMSPIRRPRTRASSPSIREDSSITRPSHPPRQSSLTSTIDLSRESPSFLNQDPFATSNYRLESTPKRAMTAGASPRVPKTPTAAFHRFQKSLSLVRKRSRPNLKDGVSRDSLSWTAVSASTTDLPLTLNTSRTSKEEEQRKPEEPSSAVTTPPQTPQTPVTYNDIVKSAKRNSTPRVLSKPPPSTQSTPPMSPIAGKRGLLSGLNMNRRRSLRIKP